MNQKDCRIVVQLEEYEGKERAKVQFINNINGGYKAKTLEGGTSFLKQLSEKAKRLPVVATGGYAKLIAAKLPEISKAEPDLTLEGLRLVCVANNR